jgi:hypothetical protein
MGRGDNRKTRKMRRKHNQQKKKDLLKSKILESQKNKDENS